MPFTGSFNLTPFCFLLAATLRDTPSNPVSQVYAVGDGERLAFRIKLERRAALQFPSSSSSEATNSDLILPWNTDVYIFISKGSSFRSMA